MKKVITFLFVLFFGVSNAATGNASDGPILAIVSILLIVLILGIGYFIDFMKNKIKDFRAIRLIKKKSSDKDEEFLNSFKKAIHELDGLSTN